MDLPDDHIPDDDALTLMREALFLLRQTGRGNSDTASFLRDAIHSTDPDRPSKRSLAWEVTDDEPIDIA